MDGHQPRLTHALGIFWSLLLFALSLSFSHFLQRRKCLYVFLKAVLILVLNVRVNSSFTEIDSLPLSLPNCVLFRF